MCLCCVNGMAGRQGPSGGKCSTAGAEQAGQLRQAYGTESTRLSKEQFSWQLTIAREAEESDIFRATNHRCVLVMRNLNRTALFICARGLYIVSMRNENLEAYLISMRIYLGLRFVYAGVEEQGHV